MGSFSVNQQVGKTQHSIVWQVSIMYRSIPKKQDYSWLAGILIIPASFVSIVWIIKRLCLETNVWEASFAGIMHILLIVFCLTLPVLLILWAANVILDSSSVFTVTPEGLFRQYKTGRKILIPWSRIEDACACCTYGEGYRAYVLRFCLDKKMDDKYKGKTDLWMPWPKHLSWRYMSLHPKKILTFEYTEEGEKLVSKYYPSYYRDKSIIPWLTRSHQ